MERSRYCHGHKTKVAEMYHDKIYHDKKNARGGGGLTKAGDVLAGMKPRKAS